MNDFSILGHKKVVITVLGGLCLLSDSCIQEIKKLQVKKLNIVFLLADDLRWNSLGCMGNPMLMTQNIDELSRKWYKIYKCLRNNLYQHGQQGNFTVRTVHEPA